MKKYLIVFLIFIFFASLISSFTNTKNSDTKIEKSVLDKFEKNEEVKIIVKVKNKSLLEKNSRLNIFFNRRIETFSGGIEIDHKFRDSFTTTISKSELDNLKLDDDVLEITESKEVHLFLQNSTGIVNATSTWPVQISGTNLTGIDQTVCVIDTGINYTHPDLGGCSNESFLNGSCSKVIGGWDFNTGTEDNDPMDYNGHGTHVAGTVAANGNIVGIAPDAKIVAVKVFNDAGSGGDQVVLANAIQWCVDNSSIYNISVITMSLGFADNQTTYCDSDPSYSGNIVVAINNAVAKNITVTAATGNDYNYTAISSPACVENATAVGATDKNDNFASYSNRNNLTDLVAPGSLINSTQNSGGYTILSGTSMATPHVAGAFALIRQFFILQNNRVPTPYEIEDALNSTGKQIYDTSSGLNFSRIDIYSAILSLDTTAPNITLITPLNNTLSSNINQTFTCNVTEELELSNMTFYLWNSSNDVINQTTINISGTNNLTSFNITNLSYGNYEWNCLAYDSNNNSAFANTNYSLIITRINVDLNSPSNNTYTNQNQTFNCSAQTTSDFDLNNITFYLWNSTNDLVYNISQNISGISNSTTFDYNFTNEISYHWNCRAYNNNSNFIFADSNYTITYDVTLPNITLISPDDSSSWESNSKQVTFQYNISDNFNIANCSLITNNAINMTNSTITNFSLTQNFTQTFTPGTYSWEINCSDLAGNQKNSSQRSFTITSPPVVITSSGGSGSGTPQYNTYNIGSEQASKGYAQGLKKGDKIEFVFSEPDIKHSLTSDYVGKYYVNFTLQSNPIKFTLGVGQSAKFNLTSPEYYDVYVKLESIVNQKANITLQTIHEIIFQQPKITEKIAENQTIETQNKTSEDIERKINFLDLEIKKFKLVIYAFIPIFIIILVFILIKRKLKNKQNSLKKKKQKKRKQRKKK